MYPTSFRRKEQIRKRLHVGPRRAFSIRNIVEATLTQRTTIVLWTLLLLVFVQTLGSEVRNGANRTSLAVDAGQPFSVYVVGTIVYGNFISVVKFASLGYGAISQRCGNRSSRHINI